MNDYDLLIIGGGPAGLTAGLYAARAGLKCMLLERGVYGGQIVNARIVENYPGFPDSISGPELAEFMRRQATKYGLETMSGEATQIKKCRDNKFDVSTIEGKMTAKAVIIATGSEYSKLGVPGEARLTGSGVSYCATCDGFFFKDREVAVIGGGDTALTDALELVQHCRKVYIIHRRDKLRATKSLQEKVFSEPKIDLIWDTVVHEIAGDRILRSLNLRNVKTGNSSILELDGVFIAVGLKPNSHIFSNIIDLDEAGFIIADEMMKTSMPGMFAAGDVRHNSLRQVITAAGDGATAASSAFKYLNE